MAGAGSDAHPVGQERHAAPSLQTWRRGSRLNISSVTLRWRAASTRRRHHAHPELSEPKLYRRDPREGALCGASRRLNGTLRETLSPGGHPYENRPTTTTRDGSRARCAGQPSLAGAWYAVMLHRGARIRTGDLADPNGARYQAAPRPEAGSVYLDGLRPVSATVTGRRAAGGRWPGPRPPGPSGRRPASPGGRLRRPCGRRSLPPPGPPGRSRPPHRRRPG
jgi:hypothetical protein